MFADGTELFYFYQETVTTEARLSGACATTRRRLHVRGGALLLAALLAVSAAAAAQGRHELPSNESDCRARHGDWVPGGPLVRPPVHQCILKTADAGKACRSSEECEGSCVLDGDPGGRDPGALRGTCSAQYPFFGCHWYLEGNRTSQGCWD